MLVLVEELDIVHHDYFEIAVDLSLTLRHLLLYLGGFSYVVDEQNLVNMLLFEF